MAVAGTVPSPWTEHPTHRAVISGYLSEAAPGLHSMGQPCPPNTCLSLASSSTPQDILYPCICCSKHQEGSGFVCFSTWIKGSPGQGHHKGS